jgi:hypothetical protein
MDDRTIWQPAPRLSLCTCMWGVGRPSLLRWLSTCGSHQTVLVLAERSGACWVLCVHYQARSVLISLSGHLIPCRLLCPELRDQGSAGQDWQCLHWKMKVDSTHGTEYNCSTLLCSHFEICVCPPEPRTATSGIMSFPNLSAWPGVALDGCFCANISWLL